MRKWLWIGALAVAAAVAATARPAVANTPHEACPSRSQVAHLPRWRPGGRLRADIDGDGRPDTVTVRVARWAAGHCAFYLTVATAGHVYSRLLGPWTLQMSKDAVDVPMRQGEWSVSFPHVEALVDLGGRGDVVVLSVGEGASNLGLSFFGVSGGRLRKLRVGGTPSVWPGGSVMDQEELACSRGGPLRVLGVGNVATRKHPNRWNFSIDTYRRRGSGFVHVAHRALNGSNAKVFAAAKRAGMPNEPLTGCSVARQPGNWGGV